MVRRKTRRMRGGKKTGLFGWLSRAHDFIKKHKIISRVGKLYGMTGLPGAAPVGLAATAASTLGYGHGKNRSNQMMAYGRRTRSSIVMRRRNVGGALVPAGR